MTHPARPEIVHIVDDDPGLLRAISRLLRSHGFEPRTYPSAAEFLLADLPSGGACLVLDLQMPELGGLEMQELLAKRKHALPIVFITGHGDIPASVRAMKAGAVDFLTKPFEDEQLVAAIRTAILKSHVMQQEKGAFERDRSAFDHLSARERQVCIYVSQGMLNKQIAAEFGTREQTVKAQRGNLMRKLGANSASDIVKLVERLRAAGYFEEAAPGS
jgi:FixJ family two-component response regulator